MIRVPLLPKRNSAPEPVGEEKSRAADDSGLRRRAPAQARFEATNRPRGRFLRWLFNGSHPEPLPSFEGTVEDPREGKLGICCSGGGIRSAAFSLGALQVLQERDELERASYLAAVSGGSYIATAISLLRKTGPEDSDGSLFGRRKPFAPGSPEEQYLRNRCSYLAPTAGDKIFLGLRLILGLLVNLVFVSLPLIGIALVLSGLVYAPAFAQLAGDCNAAGGTGCAADLPEWAWISPLAVLGLGLAFGLATLLFRWRKLAWAQFFAAWATRLLIIAAALALLLIALPYLVQWVREDHLGGTSGKGVGFGAGTLALLAGVAAQLTNFLASSKAREGLGKARKAFGKLGKGLRLGLAYFAAALVGPLMLFAVFFLSVAAGMSEVDAPGALDGGLIWAGVGVLAIFLIVYFFADLTTWSLHPFYKRRLSSVFALRRVRAEAALDPRSKLFDRVEVVPPSDPGKDDGIAVERDYDRTLALSDMAMVGGEGEEWPTLLICAAANISDTSATPPGRRVTSFTFSAHTVGGPLVGAVATEEIESAFEEPKKDESRPAKRRGRDLSLLAATAMSGAAISPSMGKMTRRPLTFLMALANIRLGVWVPNPRWVQSFRDDQELRLRYVRPRPFYLLCELFGLNRIGAKYLYVTDGGHYENLGLVELLRRGCAEIYCLDASGVGADGAEFESLGEAITLARSELGVEIEFDGEEKKFAEEDAPGEEDAKGAEDTSPAAMVPDEKTHFAKRDVVAAKVRYRSGEEGRLVYVRNAMIEAAPWDVRAHHEEDPRFPNNATVDQLYTDQKFEAYRVLGSRAAVRAVEAMGVGDGTAK
ncbi:MAG TPA: patatin-like phospholipase family protein [Solirubrobacterales bacterium]|nr:patatin-like phospholipase family protein [Solirubrobacterales bacterium]